MSNGGKGSEFVKGGNGLGVFDVVAETFCCLFKVGSCGVKVGSTKIVGAKRLAKEVSTALDFGICAI